MYKIRNVSEKYSDMSDIIFRSAGNFKQSPFLQYLGGGGFILKSNFRIEVAVTLIIRAHLGLLYTFDL